MSRNGSGTYTLPTGNPVVSGTIIEASWANSTLSDIASALTDSLSRSGQGGMSAALRIIDGTVSVPGVAFSNETGSGAYRAAAGDWYLTVLGSGIARIRSTGIDVTGALGVSGNATVGGTLGVTGASTFASLGVTGNSTVGGTLGVTGLLTATGGVSGNLTGNVTGNVSGNAGTVTNGVYTTGDQTISAVKRFSSSISVGGSGTPAVSLDVQTTGANVLTSAFTTGIDDLNFRAGFMNGVAGSAGALQARMGLFYLGVGEAATIGMYRGASATDGSIALRTAGNDRMRVISNGYIGVNTANPSQRIHIYDSSTPQYILFGVDSTAVNKVYGGVRFAYGGGGDDRWSAIEGFSPNGGGDVGLRFTVWDDSVGEVVTGRFDPPVGGANDPKNFRFNSGFGSVGIAYGCRAWVNFNGTGTVAMRGQGNVTSITDHGTGDWSANFANAMPDTNYVVNVSSSYNFGAWHSPFISSLSTGSVRVMSPVYGGGYADEAIVCISIFR